MPRKARIKSRSGIYHIILRGINRQTIFEDDVDKIKFLATVRKYKDICKYEVYSYCLMDNHIHLLMKELEEPISEAIKRISSSYVYWYNIKYERCGHLFQARFKSENVENRRYFLTVLRYIHQNPLKAGLTDNVFQSKWTSIHEYIHKATIIDIDFGLNLYSLDRTKAMQMFTDHMGESSDEQCLDDQVRARVTDDKVREYLYQLGLPNISQLQQLDKQNRDAVLSRLKKMEGVTVRQLARITGISKSVIQRVR